MQAALMGSISLGFAILMIRNIRCAKKGCAIKKDKHIKDKKSDPDSQDHIPLDQTRAENK